MDVEEGKTEVVEEKLEVVVMVEEEIEVGIEVVGEWWW